MISRCPNSNNGESGFTLLEVLITMVILTFISLGIYQAVTGAFQLREELNNDAEFHTGIRLAMSVMNRDIASSYSPTMVVSFNKLYPELAQQNQAAAAPGAKPSTTPSPSFSGVPENVATEMGLPFTYWSAAIDSSGLRPSRFQGTEKKISFITDDYSRIYKDAQESVFAKISFEVKTDDDPPTDTFKVPNSSVLIKTENPDAFDNDDVHSKSFQHSYALLRGITDFHFTFYKWKDSQFAKFTSWDSDLEDFKYELPDVIEVTMTVKGPTQLVYNGLYRFKPEIPLHGIYPSF